MKQFILYLFILTLLVGSIKAQQPVVDPLKVGERLPNISFRAFVENKEYAMNTADFKGKILLFDFWGTGCPSCIEGMPKLLKLQQTYGDKIQIILVAKEQKQDLQKYLQDLTDKKIAVQAIQDGKKLTYVYGDTVFSKLFPSFGIPMHAWIDQDQKHLAFAYPSSTTKENVAALLEGRSVKFDSYVLPEFSYWNFNYMAWVRKRLGVIENANSFSIILKRDSLSANKLNDYLKIPGTKKSIGFCYINYTPIELYRLAYFNKINTADDLVSVENENKSQFYHPPYNSSQYFEWDINNRFCYLSKVAQKDTAQLFSIMKNDLDRSFSIKSEIAIRPVKCMVLRRSKSNNDPLKSKGGELIVRHLSKPRNSVEEIVIQNAPFVYLYQDLRQMLSLNEGNPTLNKFVDETDYTGNIDVKLTFSNNINDPANFIHLKTELKRYGLELVEEYRDMKVLVIKDAKNEN